MSSDCEVQNLISTEAADNLTEGTGTQPASQVEISACEDFEAKWKAFQRRFDEALAKSLEGLAEALGAGTTAKPTQDQRQAVFGGKPPSLALVGSALGSGKYKNVVVCAGAGLSTSAG